MSARDQDHNHASTTWRDRLWGLARGTALAVSALSALAGCSRDGEPAAGAEEAIIGGVAANSPSLDAIGSLGIIDPYYGGVQPFCSATLIAPETVVTARHCTEVFSSGYYGEVVFSLGPDGYNPRRSVRVVAETEVPRGPEMGFVGYGRDVGVLHLDEPITDVRVARLGDLTDRDIGRAFAMIGYGMRDNTGVFGTRRAGNGTLRARQGRIFELMFGSFENFRERQIDFGQYLDLSRLAGSPFPSDGGEDFPSDGGVPFPDDGDGGPPIDDWYTEYLRGIYENTYLIPNYELWVGGARGDAQACHGDSGSPLTRSQGGRLTIYAVTSGGVHSPEMYCNYGAVYAALTGETLAAVDAARSWVDPCGDMNQLGVCEGDEAVRCTAALEGPRRVTRTDCSLLGQTCGVGYDGQVACVDGEFPIEEEPEAEEAPAAPAESAREHVLRAFLGNARAR